MWSWCCKLMLVKVLGKLVYEYLLFVFFFNYGIGVFGYSESKLDNNKFIIGWVYIF